MVNIAIKKVTMQGSRSLKSKDDFNGKDKPKENGVLVAKKMYLCRLFSFVEISTQFLYLSIKQ